MCSCLPFDKALGLRHDGVGEKGKHMPAKSKEKKVFLAQQDVDRLVWQLATKLRQRKFDAYMVITRGGMVPGCFVAQLLNHKRFLSASITFYDDHDQRLRRPMVLEFPPEVLLRGKRILLVDDVWDSGHSIALVRKMVERAGGIPIVATLHYKPKRSEVKGRPDYYAAKTDNWIVYPWEEPALLKRLRTLGLPWKKAKKA